MAPGIFQLEKTPQEGSSLLKEERSDKERTNSIVRSLSRNSVLFYGIHLSTIILILELDDRDPWTG